MPILELPLPIKPPIQRLTFTGTTDPLSKRINRLNNSSYQSTTYSSVMGVNMTTNEVESQGVYETLSQNRASKQSCHIGVSGWYNLDVIALRRSERGILFDSNPEVALFFDHTFRCILDSENREAFIRNMKISINKWNFDTTINLPKELLKYTLRIAPNFSEACDVDLSPEYEIDVHGKNYKGWLATEERYTFIRNLVLHNKIVTITEDITNTAAFKEIHNLLENNAIEIDTLYVSNVHHYINGEKKSDFLQTVSYLSNEKTLLIDSEDMNGLGLEQRIVRCDELKLPEERLARWFSRPSQTETRGNITLSSHTDTFFEKPVDNKKTAFNYPVVLSITLLVAAGAYIFNQLNQLNQLGDLHQTDEAPQPQP
ncbi:MAG: hypothetical protein P1U39_07170 [Legionellaceae bacterium]|nr:hypothetical protein [Legionellaceae bacterium]